MRIIDHVVPFALINHSGRRQICSMRVKDICPSSSPADDLAPLTVSFFGAIGPSYVYELVRVVTPPTIFLT